VLSCSVGRIIAPPTFYSCQDGYTIKSAKQPTTSPKEHSTTTPLIDTEDLIVHFFLLNKQEDGQRFRAHIIKLIKYHSFDINDSEIRIKVFLCLKNNESEGEDHFLHQAIIILVSKDQENESLLKCNTSHQEPIASDHPDYKGVNVIELMDGRMRS
jgi:hypothetical protein